MQKASFFYEKLDKINSLVSNKPFIEKEITDDKEKKRLIDELFKTKLPDDTLFAHFKIKIFKPYSIYDYYIIDDKKMVKTRNVVLVKNGKPVVKMNYAIKFVCGIEYVEDSYSLYCQNSNYLEERITRKMLNSDTFSKMDISILESNDNDYFLNSYELYYSNRELSAIKSKDNMSLATENSCLLMQEIIDDKFNTINNKFDNSIENNLGMESTNIYHIKHNRVSK